MKKNNFIISNELIDKNKLNRSISWALKYLIDKAKLNHVIIKDGQLIQGRLDSKIMNTGSRGLIHIIYNDYNVKVAQRFLDDLQNIVTRFLVLTGFSVGIGDLVADVETNEKRTYMANCGHNNNRHSNKFVMQ